MQRRRRQSVHTMRVHTLCLPLICTVLQVEVEWRPLIRWPPYPDDQRIANRGRNILIYDALVIGSDLVIPQQPNDFVGAHMGWESI